MLLSLHPAALSFEPNVRTDAKLSREFIASVRERGVLQPVVAYPGADGLVVQMGQRRTLAAVECGLETVPVLLVDEPKDVDRVVDQIVENDQRAELSTSDRVKGWEQLAAIGLSAAAIAKRTGAKKADVATGLKVAGSELASRAGERFDFLTLDQAAAVAEFESEPDAVKAIVAAAKTGGFEHTVQRLRDHRAEADAFAAVRAELTGARVEVIERDALEWPAARLDNHRLDPAEHVGCPGHAAYVGYGFGTDRKAEAIFVCRDVVAHGHVEASAAPAGVKRAMTEEEKAARRVVIERNREWKSATVVRREWLRAFAARKAVPEGAERFVLACLLAGDHQIRQALEAGWPLLRELLGHEPDPTDRFRAGAGRVGQLLEILSAASPKRSTVLTVAAVLCAWEDRTGPHTWRNPSTDTARYLGQMQSWGYELSDVESLAVTGREPDTEDGSDTEDTSTGPRPPVPAGSVGSVD
ncbi:hypothetical protein GCM10017577_17910 [Pseudonocardia halophobica]|uniref:ParB-like N-terminal domain-containing protein n=1 Tax=Pseudonocardia halophobica TaxID=29401 RepID=A0A9W6KZ58_9PSEU|nr:ParB N-terminal domain-containing protein [Pseudonocardia halophobica]GLL10651.1 hypothetical protein GCM10017577_17910 [Pseudonocardia halophobica]